MRELPVFPQKRPLALEDKPLFDGLFKKFPPSISELTFTNLFAWRNAYRFHVAQWEDLVFVISLKGNAPEIFEPIGPQLKKREAMRRCLLLHGLLKFVRLTEETALAFRGVKGFAVSEDRDNFDYVYLAQELIDLKGKDYDGKRNFIKRFREQYRYAYKPLTGANIKECLSFEEEWCLAKDCQHTEGLAREREAMEAMLEHFEYLGIKGAMIEVNGKVEGVTLGEPLNAHEFVIHIEKANGSLIGIYQTINQEFCARETAHLRYVNREQDLGVLGLRKSKESYHPHHMVKKFTLTAE